MSHLKGFQKPVIATPAALWILKGLLVLVSLVLVIRACTADGESIFSLAKEWAAEKNAPTSSLTPTGTESRKFILKPNTWSEWIEPPGGTQATFEKWNTPDQKLEITFHFTNNFEKTFNITFGENFDWGLNGPPAAKFKLRFRHPQGGNVWINIHR